MLFCITFRPRRGSDVADELMDTTRDVQIDTLKPYRFCRSGVDLYHMIMLSLLQLRGGGVQDIFIYLRHSVGILQRDNTWETDLL